MSLLWSGDNTVNLIANQKKPSPTQHNFRQDSAQDPAISSDDGKGRISSTACCIEGASLFTSLWKRLVFCAKKYAALFSCKISAGMTVEASILLPLFIFFFLNLGCAIEMIRLHGNLQLALWQTGSQLAVYGYALDSGELPEEGEKEDSWWKGMAGIVFSSTYVKAQLIDTLGESYLDQSPLTKGAEGLQLWESDIFGPEDKIDVVVTYSVSPWSKIAGFFSFRMANRYYAHIWNGYELPGGTNAEVKTVYLTPNGVVYHLDRNCTYLRLSVRQILSGELAEARNQYGRRYQPCEKCIDGSVPSILYITQGGACYHYSRDCPGLKRTVYAVGIDDAAGYRPCSRCGK